MQKPTTFCLSKADYRLLAVATGIVILGFLLMAGGAASDPHGFNPEVFSFRRISLAPMVILLGYALGGWAIMRQPKEGLEG
ncbi:MAG: DUF3098 domain-containing protein [Bacteroidota bacterium]